jgi:hypothetical protein
MSYDHFEHRHRFASWAGARAAQRAFAPSAVLCSAIEATSLRAFLREPASLDIAACRFDRRHRIWCNAVIKHLSDNGIEDATFGRAAKLIAVYLKAMVVVGENAQSQLASVVHPPIDRILLQSMAKSTVIRSPHQSHWRSVAWTKLDESEYYSLLGELRTVLGESEPWWKIEEYWKI